MIENDDMEMDIEFDDDMEIDEDVSMDIKIYDGFHKLKKLQKEIKDDKNVSERIILFDNKNMNILFRLLNDNLIDYFIVDENFYANNLFNLIDKSYIYCVGQNVFIVYGNVKRNYKHDVIAKLICKAEYIF